MKALFRIKFCGVNCIEEAMDVASSGADAIGFNFYPQSKRFVPANTVVDIARKLPSGMAKVGVFVNETPERVHEIASSCGLDFVQLHGEEKPDAYASIALPKIIRAIPWQGTEANISYAKMWLDIMSNRLAAFLLDAFDPVERGGTGKSIDWHTLRDRPYPIGTRPLLLAGGLRPESVQEAITLVRPDGVDAASGVEETLYLNGMPTEPVRRKSLVKMKAFVLQAQHGFETIGLKM